MTLTTVYLCGGNFETSPFTLAVEGYILKMLLTSLSDLWHKAQETEVGRLLRAHMPNNLAPPRLKKK